MQNNLELLKTGHKAELTKAGLDYLKILQGIEAAVVTDETLEAAQESAAKYRKEVKKAKDTLKAKVDIKYKAYKEDQEAAKSLTDPLDNAIDAFSKRIEAVAVKRREEEQRLAAEKAKEAATRSRITEFVLRATNKIADAKSDAELVDIEKIINLEKTRSSVYGSLLEEFVKATEPLTNLLKNQKESLRNLKKLDSELEAVLGSGNDAAAIDLQDKKEVLQAGIEQNTYDIRQMAASTYTPQYEQVAAPTVRARLSRWSYDLVDKKKALEKAPDSVEVTVRASYAKLILDKHKDEWKKEGLREKTIDGIRYYLDERY